jgi:pimeloyl-ACP methyl ester carboxylesterase
MRERHPRAGFIGHSEGGLVAALAAERASFVILLNAPGLPGRELFRMRAERLARARGLSEELIARDLAVRNAAVSPNDIAKRIESALAGLSDADRKLLGYDAKGIAEMVAFHTANATWLAAYLHLDPAPVLACVKAPVLVVAGALDQQVPADANAFALAAAKRAGGHANVEIAILPAVNHQLQPAHSGAIAQYAQIEETIAESVLQTVLHWLSK